VNIIAHSLLLRRRLLFGQVVIMWMPFRLVLNIYWLIKYIEFGSFKKIAKNCV
jgi:hypothetical protein